MITVNEIRTLANASDCIALFRDSETVFILLYPYQPYCPFPQGHIYVDAYYIASNKSYLAAKQACIILQNKGIAAEIDTHINLKAEAVSAGKCIFGCNGLAIHPDFGSYFVMQAINFGQVESIQTFENNLSENKPAINCAACERCINICPTNALEKNNQDFYKCIRSLQDYLPQKESFLHLGNCLLGCSSCRNICPYNKKILCVPPPDEVLEISHLDTLLEFDKQTELKLKQLLGSNIARKKLLIPSILSAAVLQKHPGLLKAIDKWTGHPNQAVSLAAALAREYLTKKSENINSDKRNQ